MARPTQLRQALPGLGRVLRRFAPELRRERRAIGLATAALLAEVALRLAEPWPLKLVLDRVVDGAGGAAGGPAPGRTLALCAAALVAVVSLRAAAGYASTLGFARVGHRVLTRVRERVHRHLHRLSPSYHARARDGDLVIRVVGDVGVLREVVVTALLPLLAHFAVLVAMVAVMLWLNAGLAAAALLPLLPFAWLAARRTRRIQEVGRRQRRRESELASATAESIAGIASVQALSLESEVTGAFARASERDRRLGVEGKRLAAGLERSVDVLVAVSTAIVLGYGGSLALSGALSAGGLVVFVSYLRRAFRPVRDFAKYSARLAKATAAGERILELLDQTPAVQERPDARPAPALRGEIKLERVSFSHPEAAGAPALEQVDLVLPAGSRTALVGPSGAGKSTLASLVLRLADPDSGRVLFDGFDAREFTLDSLRAQMAVLLQDAWTFAGTVRENVTCAAPDARPEEIDAAARLAAADEFIAALPEGWETHVGERGATLSRGQRQRLAIARAALRRVPILLLDEPLAGLDAPNAAAVDSALERLSRGRTTLLVTHDLETALRCDQVAFVAGGRVLESGRPADCLGAGGPLARWARGAEGSATAGAEVHALVS